MIVLVFLLYIYRFIQDFDLKIITYVLISILFISMIFSRSFHFFTKLNSNFGWTVKYEIFLVQLLVLGENIAHPFAHPFSNINPICVIMSRDLLKFKTFRIQINSRWMSVTRQKKIIIKMYVYILPIFNVNISCFTRIIKIVYRKYIFISNYSERSFNTICFRHSSPFRMGSYQIWKW